MTLKEYSELVMSMPDYKFHEPYNGEIQLVNDRWYPCVIFEDAVGEDFYLINFGGSFRYEKKNRVDSQINIVIYPRTMTEDLSKTIQSDQNKKPKFYF